MCKFCEPRRDEYGYLDTNRNEVLSFDIGIAEYVVTIRRRNNMSIELNQYHVVGGERYEEEEDFKNIEIKYCPFCGKEVQIIEEDD